MIKNVAFIPVRGGSKSIPLKNIKKINGRPLIYWTLDAATNCDDMEKVYVCTDSEEIKKVVNDYKNDKIIVINRSEMSATDEASTEISLLEFASEYNFENVALIQATSPLLQSCNLTEGFKLINEKKYESVLSVTNQKRFIWENGEHFASPVNYNPLQRPRRQDFEGFYVENGAFYITSRERLLQTKCRLSGNIGFVVMPEKNLF